MKKLILASLLAVTLLPSVVNAEHGHTDPVDIGYTEDQEEYWDALELLAVTMKAEAGNQSELGRRLVIDCILNRVESEKWPNTIEEVVYQKGQFSVVSNGSINRQEIDAETALLVLSEMAERTNTEVLSFRTGNYHAGQVPVIHEGAHYFSK